MFCSPIYRDQPRQWVSGACDHNCFHWSACLKELHLPEDYKKRVWVEVPATEKELREGKGHLKRQDNGNRYNKHSSKYKHTEQIVIWRLI